MEMWLDSKVEQEVYLSELDLRVSFAEGEGMSAEISAKFTAGSVARIFEKSAITPLDMYTDSDDLRASPRWESRLANSRLPGRMSLPPEMPDEYQNQEDDADDAQGPEPRAQSLPGQDGEGYAGYDPDRGRPGKLPKRYAEQTEREVEQAEGDKRNLAEGHKLPPRPVSRAALDPEQSLGAHQSQCQRTDQTRDGVAEPGREYHPHPGQSEPEPGAEGDPVRHRENFHRERHEPVRNHEGYRDERSPGPEPINDVMEGLDVEVLDEGVGVAKRAAQQPEARPEDDYKRQGCQQTTPGRSRFCRTAFRNRPPGFVVGTGVHARPGFFQYCSPGILLPQRIIGRDRAT